MDCIGLKNAAHAYFTGTLPEGERAAFDAHGESCADCAEFLRVCREITCREVNEFLYQYVDGDLDAERRAVFERHLAICADCRNYLATYVQATEMAKRAFAPEQLSLPTEVPADLVRAVFSICGIER